MKNPKRAAAQESEKKTQLELATAAPEDDEENDSAFEEDDESGSQVVKTKKRPRKSNQVEELCLSDEEHPPKFVASAPASSSSTRSSIVDAKRKGQVDSLWSTLNTGNDWKKKVGSVLTNLNKPKKKKTKPVMDKTLARILAAKPTKVDAEKLKQAAKSALDKTGNVKITRQVNFAGETIEVTKVVDKASKEGFLEKVEQEAKQSRNVSALDALVGGISKKTGINTVQKSNYDWEKYKADNDINDELAAKTKDGYVEKQDFLNRVDVRQFEQEKAERQRQRAKKAAQEKQALAQKGS